jgi:hypothetical protein
MNNEAVALLCGKLFKCAFLLTMFNEIEIILLNYSQFQYIEIPSSHEIRILFNLEFCIHLHPYIITIII